MSELPQNVSVAGVILQRVDAPAGIACWTAALPGDEPRSISVLIEPAEPPSTEALDRAALVIADFDSLVLAALRFLAKTLVEPPWHLTAAERERLSSGRPPFRTPEAIVWSDGSWMLRFAECEVGLGEDYGIGVDFADSEPVAVEDFSDADLVEGGD